MRLSLRHLALPVIWWLGARGAAAVLAEATSAGGLAQTSPGTHIVFDTRSSWNRVIVADHGDLRSLYFGTTDDATQSTVSLREPRSVPMEYIRHAASALALTAHRRSLLVIGLGGGTYPMLMRRAFPAMTIDVAELDPMVGKVARDYFGFVEDEKLRVHFAEGADFVKRARKRWEVIFLDAYGANDIPEALATDAFFAEVSRHLAPGGVLVANIADAESSARERTIIDRLAKRFPACVLQHTPTSDNIIVVAGAALPKHLGAALATLDREARLPFAVAPMAAAYRGCSE